MPKLSENLFVSCKKFTNHTHPKAGLMKYKMWIPPMMLKNSIIERKDRVLSERPCTEEIKALLTCFRDNEFEQTKCIDEHKKVVLCQKQTKEKSLKRTESAAAVINRNLARYPNPKVTMKLDDEK